VGVLACVYMCVCAGEVHVRFERVFVCAWMCMCLCVRGCAGLCAGVWVLGWMGSWYRVMYLVVPQCVSSFVRVM